MSNSYRNLFTAGLIVALLLVISAETYAQRRQPAKKNPGQDRSLSAQELARQTLPAVVLIDCDEGGGNHSLGSGFFITPDTIVTNYHVVKDMIRGEARTVLGGRAKRIWQISVRGFDEDSDLALLRVSVNEAEKMLVLSLAKNLTVVGDTIYAFGNPEGLAGTISPGIVSGLRSFKSGKRIQITAPISPGSSGGPVVNTRGEVIGIAVGSLTEGQNLNFAIPASLLGALLSRPEQAKKTDYDYLVELLGTEPAPPNSEERSWVLVHADEAGVRLYYVPNELVAGNNGMITGWVKMLFPGEGKTSPPRIFHEEWDCGGRRDRILHEGAEPSEWANVAPGTIDDILFKKVCYAEGRSGRNATSASNQKRTDNARDWVLLMADEKKGSRFYYAPKDAVRQRNGIFSVWTKTVFSSEPNQRSSYGFVYHSEVNCAEKKFRILHQGISQPDGQYDTIDEPTEWDSIVPKSPNDLLYERVCSPTIGTDTSARNKANQNNKGASEWKYIGTFGEGNKLYSSPAKTVREPQNLVRAWFKIVMPKTNKQVSELVLLDEFNCQEGTLRDLQTTVYYRDGKTETENKAGEWKLPAPDSTGEIMIVTICSPGNK
ncbi:MAG TPA: S1C family serine protease [Pyrinomonadaceae bacterium]